MSHSISQINGTSNLDNNISSTPSSPESATSRLDLLYQIALSESYDVPYPSSLISETHPAGGNMLHQTEQFAHTAPQGTYEDNRADIQQYALGDARTSEPTPHMQPFTTTAAASASTSDTTNLSDQRLLNLCKRGKWQQLNALVSSNPSLATRTLSMDNNIATTLLHQAITGKKIHTSKARYDLTLTILSVAPMAAEIENGYKSLPIHAATQRNVSFRAKDKEGLIRALINASPNTAGATGGTSKRTPIHLLLTDYQSTDLFSFALSKAPNAVRVSDENGYLPIHIGCSRHCSIEKIKLLIDANPDSLHARTHQGKTPLSLAKSKATKSHPNYELIKILKRCTEETPVPTSMRQAPQAQAPATQSSTSPARISRTTPDVARASVYPDLVISNPFIFDTNEWVEGLQFPTPDQTFSMSDVGERAEV